MRSVSACAACCALLSMLAAAPGRAQVQEGSGRFRIRVAGAVSGTEEYRIERSPQGWQVSGKTRLDRQGAAVELVHALALDPEGMLMHYRLDAAVGGRPQVIEARRSAGAILMRAEAAGQSQERKVDEGGRMVVLDNLVVAHYQVLMDLARAGLGEKQTFRLLVPQTLAAVTGTLSPTVEDTGLLDGRAVKLHKLSLEIGGTLIELWCAAAGNALMRVAIPVQSAEFVREGFEPARPPAPAEKEPADFLEREISFASGGLQIPGTLCLPHKSAGRVPGIVMVAGSGPNDRDETIGPNKPFRDIARGLAAAGIATLRYDKRTFALRGKLSPEEIARLTVREEVIDDAAAALAFLARAPEIDPAAVFLLGHSLGATLAPYVVEGDSPARGVILMAPAARSIDELICKQAEFQAILQGLPEDEIGARIGKLREAFADVRSGRLPDTAMVFFASARYWRDLFARDTPAAMAAMRRPVLLLHGAKDIQCTVEEYELVRRALERNRERAVHSLLFPDLNHLFMKVEGQSTGAEYGRPGRVDPEVVAAIAAWVRRTAGR